MIAEILTEAGLTFRHIRFLKPPQGTYAVWQDDIVTDGADGESSGIFEHNYTVELYEPTPDDTSEAALEAAFAAHGIHYRKEDRYWLQDTQRYQTSYDFTLTSKESAS